MLTRSLREDAELTTLEPWQAEEFAAHIDSIREHLKPWVGMAAVVVDTESARAYLQRYADLQAADSGRIWGIRLRGELAGGVMFRVFDVPSGNCELGVWLAPWAQGKGLITLAVQHLADWAFDTRGMARVEWRNAVDNAASAAVAKRLGMTQEGLLRSEYPVNGGRQDGQVWSLVRADPRPWRS
ncbi:GNAT family N-acetyltransferase [Amycolatopsis sp. NPDC059027]|uniref:GNAT family N-acetyltransferase n=1 Tax=unclassified Amycolatopsis TaxID=2618356 RepID=UPI00366AF1A7